MKTRICFSLMGLAAVLFMASCSSDDADNAGPSEPITITKADFPIMEEGGETISYWESQSLPVPEVGDNRTWDYRNSPVDYTRTLSDYFTYSNPAFPTGNVSFPSSINDIFSGQLRTLIEVRELSDEGYFNLGREYTSGLVVSLLGGAGTLEYLDGAISTYEPKRPIFMFPMTYGDKTAGEYKFLETYVANLPSAGINDVTAGTEDTWDVTVEVAGWGKLLLPGYSQGFDVLMVKEVSSANRQFLLGGMPAPEQLLTQLGIANGPVSAGSRIFFFAKNHGIIATFIYDQNDDLVWGFFRDNLK